MALTDIIYLTKTQYDTLVGSGSITVGGVTYNYDANADYRVKLSAEDIPYDNSISGLTATNLQDAIDELAAR